MANAAGRPARHGLFMALVSLLPKNLTALEAFLAPAAVHFNCAFALPTAHFSGLELRGTEVALKQRFTYSYSVATENAKRRRSK